MTGEKNRAWDHSHYRDWIDPEAVVPYENNAKVHTREQVRAIAESIRRYGWQQDVVLTADDVLVIGHGRRLAALEIGCEMPYHRVGKNADALTSAEIMALRLVDNMVNESAWDERAKAEELKALEKELDALGLELDMAAFEIGGGEEDSTEAAETPVRIEEDDGPDETAPQRCRPGDVWIMGDHRLMCGDSTNPEAWSRLMDGQQGDMVFTDPPYGVAIGDKNATLNTIQNAGRCTENISGDTMTEEQLYSMLKSAFVNIRENCAEDAVYYVTSPQGGSLCLMMMMMRDAGLAVRHVLIWRKNTPTFSLGRLDYDYQHEPIFYTWTKKHHNFRNGQYRGSVWDFDKPLKSKLHPTMKPVALVENAILDGTQEGMIVIDAFGGSGTTLIAAERNNRRARIMEIDPHYCDVIVKRWEDMTGRTAFKAE